MPLYAGGELTINSRSYWGDLKFETRAARARLFTLLSQLRTQMPRVRAHRRVSHRRGHRVQLGGGDPGGGTAAPSYVGRGL